MLLYPINRLQINELCRLYVGTRKYHNYTKKLRYSSGAAQRLIKEFYIEEVLVIEGVEFAKFRIEGQSFLYHQIRKMIGKETCLPLFYGFNLICFRSSIIYV